MTYYSRYKNHWLKRNIVATYHSYTADTEVFHYVWITKESKYDQGKNLLMQNNQLTIADLREKKHIK